MSFVVLGGAIGLHACINGKNTDNNQNQSANNKQTSSNIPVSEANKTAQNANPSGQNAKNNIYSPDEHVIGQGKQLFQSNCTACHNFEQKGIGPNLAGVTARTTSEWLTKFVSNAPAVIKSGDARATKLYEEYKQMMPPFTAFSETDIQAILAYLHTQQAAAEDENTAKLGPPLPDPIPTKIPKSELLLHLEPITTAPATADKIPLARINTMVVLPGKKNRVFIQDLRGKLYEMEGKNLREYLDISKERPAFIPSPGLATGFGSYAFHPKFYQNGLVYTTHTEKANAAPADFVCF